MKHLFPITLILILSLFFFLGCASEEDEDNEDTPSTFSFPSGWHWGMQGDCLVIFHDRRKLLSLSGVDRNLFSPKVKMLFGFFDLNRRNASEIPMTLVTKGDRLILTVTGSPMSTFSFKETEAGNLRVTLTMAPDYSCDSLRFKFDMKTSAAFWGFGEQYNFIDFKGRNVPIWLSEQGVGRAAFSLLPFVGTLTDSYFPMPYFMDPKNGYGFLIENSEYSLFDLGQSDPAQWSVEVWNGQEISFLVLPGPKPANVVKQLTAQVGRPTSMPPDWAFSGAWIAAQNGTDAVRARIETAIDAGIPVTACWAQDWLGQRNFGLDNYGVKYRWNWDEDLYPDLPELIEEFNEQGVRFLGYFNNFVCPRYEQWDQGVANDYLIQDVAGDPYLFLISVFFGSVVDMSNPDAAAWFQDYARAAVDMGMSGWMADFGEWLPFDSQIYQGTAPAFHNLYPTAWHKVNREVLEEAHPDGDWVMFTRSGFTGEHKVAQIVWAGDQEATWDERDGLPTVLKAGLSIGLSGIPIFTHDIGGFSGGPRTKDLFFRWTELGAFTPVMRTHDGLKKFENHMFDTDEETLAFFARFAKIHQALLPLWKKLNVEAVEDGLPMIRHTVLVDPDWEFAYDAHAQWMLGDDVLFAPVVRQGENHVQVYFPTGTWEHLLSGETVEGPVVRTVSAPVGTPAVYVRQGTWKNVVEDVRAASEVD